VLPVDPEGSPFIAWGSVEADEYRRQPAAYRVEEYVRADQLAGAVEALREAIEAARLFNRSGMTWSEYDALLARLERDHLGGQ
jgi:hypothetical protein